MNKNKIMRAVQEGILTGFKISSNKVNDSSYIDFGDSKVDNVESLNIEKIEKQTVETDFIDLGLPSRTMWAKCNLYAICGNDLQSWYGGFYAWGELKSDKKFYDSNNYDYSLLNNYDNENDTLRSENDVVTLHYYEIDKFKIPTKEDFEELMHNTIYKWETNYNGVENLNGMLYVSKINGNSIFIPAAGLFYEDKHSDEYEYCLLWTSTINIKRSDTAYYFITNEKSDICYNNLDYCDCYYGLNVRGVYKQN